ncbi:MAG TPA: hypothetical protein VFV94_14780 [Polyangiaceae bacterium]|nr:hypothetical protein [Polyangiaceae bacterium]
MRGRRQEASALVAALGLHAAALGLLRSVGGSSLEPPRHSASHAEDLLELDLDVRGPDASGAVAQRDHADEARPASRTEMARLSARATAHAIPRTSEAQLETSEPETAAEVPDAETGAPPSKPIDLGLGPNGWQRWMTAPSRAETPQPAAPARNRYEVFRATRASTTGGLQEGLDEKDRARGLALGLGPEGRVLSALQKAAHAPEAPEAGVARFVVTVQRTGAVEVTLGAASGQHEQWQKLAKHIANDLRSSPPRIPPPHEGFKYAVEVVAEQTLPNGMKAKSLKKPHLDAPLKFQDEKASVEQLTRENPAIASPTPDDIALKLDTPGLYVAQNNGVCDYRAGVGSISPGYQLGAAAGAVIQGACDPTHIGAKSQRIVRTRVVAQSLF